MSAGLGPCAAGIRVVPRLFGARLPRDCYLRHRATRCVYYTCPQCKRRVPQCFGAADDQPEVCDNCYEVDHG